MKEKASEINERRKDEGWKVRKITEKNEKKESRENGKIGRKEER